MPPPWDGVRSGAELPVTEQESRVAELRTQNGIEYINCIILHCKLIDMGTSSCMSQHFHSNLNACIAFGFRNSI